MSEYPSEMTGADGPCDRMQDDLREQVRQMQTLADHSPDQIFRVDRNHRYIFVNRRLAEVTGIPAEQWLGYTHHELKMPQPLCALWDQFFAEVFEGGRVKEYEYVYAGREGTRHYLGRLVPELDDAGEVKSLLGITRDITERKLAEEQLVEGERRYRALVEDMNAIVWELDLTSQRFTFVSRRAELILGYPILQWTDRQFWIDHIHPEDRQRCLEYCDARINQGRDHALEYRMTAANGSIIWVHDLVRVIKDEFGRPRRLRGLMVDVTERKRDERLLAERQSRLELYNTVAMSISEGTTVDAIIELTIREIATRFPAYRVSFCTIDLQGRLSVTHSINPESMPCVLGYCLDLTQLAPGYLDALNQQRCFVVRDARDESLYAGLESVMESARSRSVLEVTVRSEDELQGLICLDLDQPHEWIEHEVQTLLEASDFLSVAINRATEQRRRMQAEKERARVIHELEQTRDNLVRLLRATSEMQAINSEDRALELAAGGVRKAGWGSVVVYLFDQRWHITAKTCRGLTEKEVEALESNQPTPRRCAEMFGEKFAGFRLSRSYFVPVEALNGAAKAPGEPGRTRIAALRRWGAGDSAYVPLTDHAGRVLGVILLDRPVDGKRPDVRTFRYLESFADMTARTVENLRLAQERASALQTAREISGVLETYFASTLTCLALLDTGFHILRVNESFAAAYGSEATDLVGRHVFDLVPTGMRDSFDQVRRTGQPQTALAQPMSLGEMDDSVTRWCDWTIVPVYSSEGRVDKVVFSLVDVSERRRAEQERERLAEQLRHVQKMDAVGTFAAGIAHDFNNVLTAIGGYADFVGVTCDGQPAVEEAVEGIMSAVSQATGITRSLLTFSSRKPMDKEPVELRGLINRTIGMLRRMMPANILITTTDDTRPLWVQGDPTQLQQVLMNLAINARDAMPQGGRLRFELTPVQSASVRQPGDSGECPQMAACLIVEDTGCGIPKDVKSRIFDPFFTTKSRGQGTGLGLSVVHGIIREHSGEIRVESAEGRGTRFSIFLPTCPEPEKIHRDKSPDRMHRGQGEVILLAEDDRQVSRLVRETLSKAGYVAVAAADGEEALRRFEECADEVAAVIVDVDLPGCSGLDCLHQWRQRRPDLPALVISGLLDIQPPEVTQTWKARMLRKPFPMSELLSVVAELLAKPETAVTEESTMLE